MSVNSVSTKTTKPEALEPKVFCINTDPEPGPQKHPWEHHGNCCQALKKKKKAFRDMEHKDWQDKKEEQNYLS